MRHQYTIYTTWKQHNTVYYTIIQNIENNKIEFCENECKFQDYFGINNILLKNKQYSIEKIHCKLYCTYTMTLRCDFEYLL